MGNDGMEGFNYIIKRPTFAPISFGSKLQRDPLPLSGPGLSSFMARSVLEQFPTLSPNKYNVKGQDCLYDILNKFVKSATKFKQIMDQRKIFGFKNIIFVAFILITYNLNQIAGAPQRCEHLKQCIDTFENITIVPSVSSRDDLNQLCSKLDESLTCIRDYKAQCMKEEDRDEIDVDLNHAIAVINEICKQGPNQDEFLRHAPCLHRGIDEYEICKNQMIQKVENDKEEDSNETNVIKKVCCIAHEYKKCTINAARKLCGEQTAEFSKAFIQRISPKILTCAEYDDDKCNPSSATIIIQKQ